MTVLTIVDDDAAVRESLRFLLETHGFDVVEYTSGDALLDEPSQTATSCILLDVKMPGRDGLETLQAWRERGQSEPIIMMSGHADVSMAMRAMRMGAQDFVEKPFEAKDLMTALKRVLTDRRDYLERQSEVRDSERRLATLTPREREIAELLTKGLANKEVARQLGISVRTVETHRANLLSKLGIKSLSQLVRLVLRS